MKIQKFRAALTSIYEGVDFVAYYTNEVDTAVDKAVGINACVIRSAGILGYIPIRDTGMITRR